MTKKKLVIASVLKPINDVRMYEKFALSIRDTGKYEVHIIGFPSTIPNDENIVFNPHPYFKRLSIGRLLLSFKIFKKIIKLKPEIIIVNTHELLGVTVAYKILFGGKIFYDLQENYFRNLWFQNNYLWGLKHILAIIIRIKERLLIPLFDEIIVAENKYLEEMTYLSNNTTIILNKCKRPSKDFIKVSEKNNDEYILLYSGTVAEVYGIWEAINFYKTMKLVKKCSLIIVGHCPNNQLFNLLNKEGERDLSIKLSISLKPVDHSEIIKYYPVAHFALTPYQYNPSIKNCIPVKFYEYSAYKIPVIIPTHNSCWKEFLSSYGAFIEIEFNKLDKLKILVEINKSPFAFSKLPENFYWEFENNKLLNLLALNC